MQAGIPYFTLPELGPFQPFGIMVAIGLLLGVNFVYRRTERLGFDLEHARKLVFWCAACGFVGAHVFEVLAYQPESLREDPLLLLKIWTSMSSFGGFLGGTAGFFIYARRNRLPLRVWADTIMYGLVPGMVFGRLGCAIVHDHIGKATTFPLAQNYTEAVIREHGYRHIASEPGLHHNLGLYEFLFLLVLWGVILRLDRKPRQPGLLVAAAVAMYMPVRFSMEFLRLEVLDRRYAGLTFAQWVAIGMSAVAVYLVMTMLRSPLPAAQPVAGASAGDGPGEASQAGASGGSQKGNKGGGGGKGGSRKGGDRGRGKKKR